MTQLLNDAVAAGMEVFDAGPRDLTGAEKVYTFKDPKAAEGDSCVTPTGNFNVTVYYDLQNHITYINVTDVRPCF